jgi:hypothetical protein
MGQQEGENVKELLIQPTVKRFQVPVIVELIGWYIRD